MSWYVVTVPISSREEVPGKVGLWRIVGTSGRNWGHSCWDQSGWTGWWGWGEQGGPGHGLYCLFYLVHFLPIQFLKIQLWTCWYDKERLGGREWAEKEGDKRRQSHAVIWGKNTIPSPLGLLDQTWPCILRDGTKLTTFWVPQHCSRSERSCVVKWEETTIASLNTSSIIC